MDVTGGTSTGRVIAATAGENLAQVVAELGGKAPMLVFEDVVVGSGSGSGRKDVGGEEEEEDDDEKKKKENEKKGKKENNKKEKTDMSGLDQVINTCAFAAFIASGQTCVSGSRLLVQEGIYEEVGR